MFRTGFDAVRAKKTFPHVDDGLIVVQRNRPSRTDLDADLTSIAAFVGINYGVSSKSIGQLRRRSVGVLHRMVPLLQSGENYFKHSDSLSAFGGTEISVSAVIGHVRNRIN